MGLLEAYEAILQSELKKSGASSPVELTRNGRFSLNRRAFAMYTRELEK